MDQLLFTSSIIVDVIYLCCVLWIDMQNLFDSEYWLLQNTFNKISLYYFSEYQLNVVDSILPHLLSANIVKDSLKFIALDYLNRPRFNESVFYTLASLILHFKHINSAPSAQFTHFLPSRFNTSAMTHHKFYRILKECHLLGLIQREISLSKSFVK